MAAVAAIALITSSCMVNGTWAPVANQPIDRARLFSPGLACPTTIYCLAVESSGVDANDSGLQHWDGSTWSWEDWDDTVGVKDTQCVAPDACWVWIVDRGANYFQGQGAGFLSPWPRSAVEGEPGFPDPPAMSCAPSGCVFLGDGTTTWDRAGYHVHARGHADTGARGLVLPLALQLHRHRRARRGHRDNSHLPVGWGVVDEPAAHLRSPGSTFEPVDMSCTSTIRCLAVGAQTDASSGGQVPATALWDGTLWSRPAVPVAGAGALTSISCVNTLECLAVGRQGADLDTSTAVVLTWTGQGWLRAPQPPGSELASYDQVSCPPGRGWCMALGADNHVPDDGIRGLLTAVYTWS